MEQRREIVNQFVQLGLSTQWTCQVAGIPRSTYYYVKNGKRKGKLPSVRTYMHNGSWISNEELVKLIETICAEPFIDYGYDRVTLELSNRGYIINRKKVYRLMKENNLLYPKRSTRGTAKRYVKYTNPNSTEPYATVELDIKYEWIAGEGKTAYMLTALDTLSRQVIDWKIGYSMKTCSVIELIIAMIETIKANHNPLQIVLRTDNGPQFIAKQLREKLKDLPYDQEFIRPATPQQNAHIESYHSVVSKLVSRNYTFQNLEHAYKVISEFVEVYNNKRIIKVIAGKAPNQFLQAWKKGFIGTKQKNNKKIFFFREKPDFRHGSPLEDFVFAPQTKEEKPIKKHQPII